MVQKTNANHDIDTLNQLRIGKYHAIQFQQRIKWILISLYNGSSKKEKVKSSWFVRYILFCLVYRLYIKHIPLFCHIPPSNTIVPTYISEINKKKKTAKKEWITSYQTLLPCPISAKYIYYTRQQASESAHISTTTTTTADVFIKKPLENSEMLHLIQHVC